MALKTYLNEDEAYGLTQEERKIAEKYLRKNKTAGALDDLQSAKLFELYLIGTSFQELASQFPQYPLAQIVLTAALKQWPKDRDAMMWTLKDRLRAKVVKSIIEQTDFLTSMLAVCNVENIEQMRNYMLDPVNNPLPAMRIRQLKEYQTVLETLQKLMTGVPGAKASSLLEALAPGNAPRLMGAAAERQEKEDEVSINDVVMD